MSNKIGEREHLWFNGFIYLGKMDSLMLITTCACEWSIRVPIFFSKKKSAAKSKSGYEF